MEEYLLGIILPVISLNDYSSSVIKKIGDLHQSHYNIEFIFICAESSVVERVSILLKNKNRKSVYRNIKIINGNSISSNYLRGQGYKYVNSNLVFYQDCDDFVDYEFLSEFCKNHYPNDDSIICFNISREIFNELGVFQSRTTLYKWKYKINSNENGKFNPKLLDNLDFVPTNIVNKIIPKKYLEEVIFLNLPYTQDWSISFQLFLLTKHFLFDYNTYLYNNYPQSSAHISKTTIYGLKRVVVLKRFIINIYNKSTNHKKMVKLLSFKFELMLQQKFQFLNIPYFPKPPYPIYYFISRYELTRVLKTVFQLGRSFFILIKFLLSSILQNTRAVNQTEK
jgi:hypothetical protein